MFLGSSEAERLTVNQDVAGSIPAQGALRVGVETRTFINSCMIYYTIYKVTNKIDGKIYIGSHKTKDLNDNYMGSGKYLKYAQKKHGIENFTKEILYVLDTPEAMYAKEAELVTEDFIAESNTYNIKVGGFGGFDYINSARKNLYGCNGRTPNVKDDLKRGRETQKFLRENNPKWVANVSEKISNSLKGRPSTFKGRHHTEETKRVIGEKNSAYQKGKGNSQYGKRWIYSLELQQSKKIEKGSPLPLGWIEGRKLKF